MHAVNHASMVVRTLHISLRLSIVNDRRHGKRCFKATFWHVWANPCCAKTKIVMAYRPFGYGWKWS